MGADFYSDPRLQKNEGFFSSEVFISLRYVHENKNYYTEHITSGEIDVYINVVYTHARKHIHTHTHSNTYLMTDTLRKGLKS